MSSNPLVSSAKPTESSLHAALHPLVLLTISDYITRHTLRDLKIPIVGALIGQQNGREITIEHAYDVKLLPPSEPSSSGGWQLNEAWFEERLQQYKDVHKQPALDLVGWWTVAPTNGPGPEVPVIHQQVLKHHESALLLTFHPDAIIQGEAIGGKLPLTIYENVYENVKGADAGSDEAMQVEGEEEVAGEKLEMRLKELRYEISTGEAEMISVDFVARGGGNATAIESAAQPKPLAESNSKGKGKAKGAEKKDNTRLLPEEEELISFLTSRANAIKMLQERISLIKDHLNSLPPSYLTTDNPPTESPEISHPVLRSILALVAKLPLIVPSDTAAFKHEQAAERSDVALVKLLGDIGKSVQDARELGSKFVHSDVNRKNNDKLPALLGSFAEGDTGMPTEYDRDLGII